ncbi:MAG: hypothetical protein BEU05_00525 [Marine Group III euryarchaeote CG-Bathy2]|uniref:Uncharacterized protein n=3 Tax=Methanobacteriati TaxID=3366610 RepID=A0A075GT52_9EURY|nr:hypothetical protein [uncultured marine group II/III euryarchaeote KM3_177_C07]AIF09326.1 hypothetical protein [uncultured marine group II/III euryarchaeote KM3_35_H09]OIR13042.1 MAG: hypothetical protein BEU05_00525 [Marine Group III euryarchaeote CG-Bathy2]
MNRTLPSLLLAALLLSLLLTPATQAHDPPPETSGLMLWLSDDQDPGRLLREGVAAAQDGSELIAGGGEQRIGSWLTPPLASDLAINDTMLTVVMYTGPTSAGEVSIRVNFMVDGATVAGGEGNPVQLYEPFVTNIPFQSDRFALNASAGSTLELEVFATVTGVGVAEFVWGRSDADAHMALENWMPAAVSGLVDDGLGLTLTTPWACDDVLAATLLLNGPVDDHDAEWPAEPSPGPVAADGVGCDWHMVAEPEFGTFQYRWQVTMVDSEQFNVSGYYELQQETVTAQAPVFATGGALAGAASFPALAALAGIATTARTLALKREQLLALLALLGLLLGSLLGLELLAVMLAGVALVGWTIRPLSPQN